MDAVVHCAMGRTPRDAPDSFDVNVKSVYLTLRAAHEAGVPHAVYISSMSVYREPTVRRPVPLTESVPPDATDVYGLTKRLGEQVCQAATIEWGRSVTVLRLAWPTADEHWPAWGLPGVPELVRTSDGVPIEGTAATDLAAALLAALEYRDGYQVFTISGDRGANLWRTDRARELLGWEPAFGTFGS
jgi:nucleoside-diphosphate-sugar epimerase